MIGIMANIFMINFITNKGEVSDNGIEKRQLCILGIISMACFAVVTLYALISHNMSLFCVILCAFWLLFMALMDKISGYVYEIMEYYALIPVCFSLYEVLTEMFINRTYIAELLISQLFVTTVYGLMSRIGLFGEGDGDILAVCGLIKTISIADNDLLLPFAKVILINMQLFLIAFIIFFITNIKNVDLKRLRMKKRIPFIPSIFFSFVIIIIL